VPRLACWRWRAAVRLLLRGRLFPTPVQRIPLLIDGTAGLGLLVLGAAAGAPSHVARLSLLLVVLILAGIVLAAGLVYSRRSPSPYVGRIADIVDVLTIIVLVPLACGAIGLYHTIQELFAGLSG
jgi:hypothetical protein